MESNGRKNPLSGRLLGNLHRAAKKTIIFSVFNYVAGGQASRFDSIRFVFGAGVALTARLLLFNINFAKLKSIFP